MKTKKLFKIQRELAKRLGEDLVIALALDNGSYLLSISSHKSTQSFKTDRNMQTCEFSKSDLNEDSGRLIDEIVKLYSGILYVPDTENKNETM